jgi:hypothetical protein
MNKRQIKKNKKLDNAIRAAFKELRKMPEKKFRKLLEDNKPDCTPETCQGECQGMGYCEMAISFRNEIPNIIKEHKIEIDTGLMKKIYTEIIKENDNELSCLENCQGQCQGMGTCEAAISFRKK